MNRPKLSANLGFLFTDVPLPDAIHAARQNGFDAVECHWPFDEDPSQIRSALADSAIPLLGLNTVRGNLDEGDFGLCALHGRENEAKAAIDQAVSFASEVGSKNVHVMAGRAHGNAARKTFEANLAYACDRAQSHDIGILIEPINHRDVSDYFLWSVEQGAEIIRSVGASNLKLMFDCYHTQIMQGDLLMRIQNHLDVIGHIQIAAVPDRHEPDHGEVDFQWLLPEITKAGYQGYFGAEYKPAETTTSGLNWLRHFR